MPNVSSVAPQFKNAFVGAAALIFEDPFEGDEVLVSFGRPTTLPPDIIAFTAVRSDQDPATFGTSRSRDELLELDVIISVQRGGRDDLTERLCSERAYRLLAQLEVLARSTDTTMDDTVRECVLISHKSEGSTSSAVLKDGRCIDIFATFQAKARISN